VKGDLSVQLEDHDLYVVVHVALQLTWHCGVGATCQVIQSSRGNLHDLMT
jgi:hypothetical protein